MTHDYHNLVEQYVSERDIGTYQVSGNATCILTGRISYFSRIKWAFFPCRYGMFFFTSRSALAFIA